MTPAGSRKPPVSVLGLWWAGGAAIGRGRRARRGADLGGDPQLPSGARPDVARGVVVHNSTHLRALVATLAGDARQRETLLFTRGHTARRVGRIPSRTT